MVATLSALIELRREMEAERRSAERVLLAMLKGEAASGGVTSVCLSEADAARVAAIVYLQVAGLWGRRGKELVT